MRQAVTQFIILCILSSCIAMVCAEQKDSDLIRVRAEPWQQFTHADGTGYFYELINAIYAPLGYQVEFEFCEWRRCMFDVMQDKADIVIGVYDTEPALGGRALLTPHYPVHFERNAVAFKRERWPDWQQQKTLANKIVAQKKGYGLTKHLEVPVDVVEYINGEQAWSLLLDDKVDFIIDGTALLERQCKKQGLNGELIRIEPIFEIPSYLGYSDTEKGAILLREFEQQLPKLYRAGIPQQLQKKWQLRWSIPLVKTNSSK